MRQHVLGAHRHGALLEALIQTHAQLTRTAANTAAELDGTRQKARTRYAAFLEQSQTKQQQDQEQAKLRFDALSTRHTQLTQERDQLESTRRARTICWNTRAELL